MKTFWILLFCIGALFASEITLPGHFSADFVQTVTNPENRVITYKGNVAFSRENLLKWFYTSPKYRFFFKKCVTAKENCLHRV